MLLGPHAPAPVPAAWLRRCWDAGCWVTVGIAVPAGARDGPGLVTALAGFWDSPKGSCSCLNLTTAQCGWGCQAFPRCVMILDAKDLQS